jgi:hypothetical protein
MSLCIDIALDKRYTKFDWNRGRYLVVGIAISALRAKLSPSLVLRARSSCFLTATKSTKNVEQKDYKMTLKEYITEEHGSIPKGIFWAIFTLALFVGSVFTPIGLIITVLISAIPDQPMDIKHALAITVTSSVIIWYVWVIRMQD